jgi:AcrB/AcrD/AcrF family
MVLGRYYRDIGDGGEQNAPLGRAVIGGLIFATAATLFFVPTVFMLVNKMKRVGTEGGVLPRQPLGKGLRNRPRKL